MMTESLTTYWLNVREFRLNLKKIVIPFNVFFRLKEESTNNNQSVEMPIFEVEI